MTRVRSTWTTVPLTVDGFLRPSEYSSAGSLPIPAGFLMVKNDAESLYIGLDVVGDTGNDSGTNDYFWLLVDVDRNGAPTAHTDVMYGIFPGEPNHLGRWPVLGPGTTEPIPSTQVIASAMRQGFWGTFNSTTPHRNWEIRLNLAEIGVDLSAAGPPPVVKVGVRVASSNPGFVFDFPPNAPFVFTDFVEIVLATRPDPDDYAGLAGPMIGGVGLCPARRIDSTTGLATTTMDPGYRLQVTNAAFGGLLDIYGLGTEMISLFNSGARRFVVKHRWGVTLPAESAPWSNLRTTWSNIRQTATADILESFGPDASDRYPLINPATTNYSIRNLLFEWPSYSAPNGYHQFELEFVNGAGAVVSSPAQRLTIFVDNTAPDTRLIELYHGTGDDPVPACGMITMSGPDDGIRVKYRAFDPEGQLAGYRVDALWGQGQSANPALDGDTYAAHSGSISWQGTPESTTPLWHPPVTCAYTFRVSASGRVTDGYSNSIQSSSIFRNVTINVPFITLKLKPAAKIAAARPLGFTGDVAVKGITPPKLGKETIVRR